MRPIINITDQRFGRLIALEETIPIRIPRGNPTVQRRYLCECDCGKRLVIRFKSLRSGNSRSCGCWRIERIKKSKLVHGASSKRTKTYGIWSGMLFRCNNPTHKNYKYYGARGIKVCERWQGKSGFINFLADMGECPEGMSLDRYPDKNGNYEPPDCRWTTPEDQANNTRRNVLIWTGENYVTMAQFARAFGIPYSHFNNWYRRQKMTIPEILIKKGFLD